MHLPAGGSTDPTVTVFRNDTSSVPRGKAELVVAHTATVPEADVRVNGKVLFSNIANGESLNLTVPVATYKVAITPTGKTSPVYLGPVSLTVKGGAVNRVYALGDPDNNTMNVAVHVLATGVVRLRAAQEGRHRHRWRGCRRRPVPRQADSLTRRGRASLRTAAATGAVALALGLARLRCARFRPWWRPPPVAYAPAESPSPADGSAPPATVGKPAASNRVTFVPDRVVLPGGDAAPVQPAVTRDGELQVPENVQHVGWWDGSARAGDPFGNTVIAGHVDSATDGLGFFVRLLVAEEGRDGDPARARRTPPRVHDHVGPRRSRRTRSPPAARRSTRPATRTSC